MDFRGEHMNHMGAKLVIAGMLVAFPLFGQSPADSATIMFRTYQPAGNTLFVPGQFNNWGPNSSGVIAPGAPSQMSYDGALGAYTKFYTFKIKDAADPNRTLGDSVYQYKFNRNGLSTGWYSDPLNAETNPGDNNNSVLRLTRLFWFEYYATVSGEQITRITAGLVHANSDAITSIKLSTGVSEQSPLTTVDITSRFIPSKRLVDYTLPIPIGKLHFVRLVAYNNQGDSVVYTSGGIVVSSMPLPAYAKHGVTLPSPASGDSVTFRLRIPGRSYVLLRIAPAGQDPALAAPITMRNGGGGNWWVNVKLSAGSYEYLYELETSSKIYDPWGRWNGDRGSRFAVGPAGHTADDYVWQSASYIRPPLERVVLYELNVGEFTGGFFNLSGGEGTFDHLKALLPYFDSLGVNAVELMPVNDYGTVGRSGFSWGYDLNSYFALEPGYGTPLDFKELVDSAHAMGIAIVVDAVFNHINDTSPLWQMLPQEYVNPYFKACNDYKYNEDGFCFFKDLNHWVPETQELVYAALKMWIDEYRIDGFRYDYTQGIGWHKDSTNSGILGWANRIDQDYGGTVYQMAEHLPESPALLSLSGLTSGWHDSFHDELENNEAYNESMSMSSLQNLVLGLGAYGSNDDPSTPSSYASRTGPVNHTVNHDELSLIYQMKYYAIPIPPDSIIWKRDKLYGALMFTSLGIPMLWQGVEMGAPRGWADGGERLSYRPLEANYLSLPVGQEHFEHYRTLIRQRTMNPALYRGTMVIKRQYFSNKTLVWGFDDADTGAQVMVVANFKSSPALLSDVPWLGPGTWYDVFDQSTLQVTDTLVPLMSVPAYTARIYSSRSDVELGIVTGLGPEDVPLPSTTALEPNYPNPFNPSTTIRFTLSREDIVSLKVFNMLGQEVATLVEGTRSRGEYRVQWDGRTSEGVAAVSGVYIIRLTTSGYSSAQKALLLR